MYKLWTYNGNSQWSGNNNLSGKVERSNAKKRKQWIKKCIKFNTVLGRNTGY